MQHPLRSSAALVLLLGLGIMGLSSEVAAIGMAPPEISTNKKPIAVGQVTGELGYLATIGSGESPGPWINSEHGCYANGTTCTGAQVQTSESNYVIMKAYYEEGGPTEATFHVEVTLTGKNAAQDTVDWTCPQGPPKWSATATLTTLEAATGAPPPGGVPMMGSVTQAFAHASPRTVWMMDGSNGGPGYADQESQKDFPFTFDPNDPTGYFEARTATTVTFSGSATEIDVRKSELRARVRVEMTMLP